MYNLKKIPASLIVAAGLGLNFALAQMIPAQANQASPRIDRIVAQSSDNPSTPRRRIKPSFFEEERRARFGFGDFLESALDGRQNAFGSDDTTSIIQNIAFDAISIPVLQGLSGTITVSDFEDNDIGTFLNTTFVGENVNLQFTNSVPNSDERTGSITVNGTVTTNGRTFIFENQVREYNAGFSNKGDDVSAVFLIVDPNDPDTAIFIQLPRTGVEGADDLNDDDDVVSGPANLTIGLPTDR